MNDLIVQTIQRNIEGQFEGRDLLPLNLLGSPGIGKTSTIREIASRLDAGFLDVSLPSKNLEYFNGIPSFVDAPQMAKYTLGGRTPQSTEWSVPEMILSANLLAEEHGQAIILLDDFHKLNVSTSAIMYELLLERKIGRYRLHPRVAIICAQNASEEAGMQVMESPIKDRLSLMESKFDFNYWHTNYGKFLHHYISSFLKNNPQYTLEEESVDLESTASPRSWHQLSNEFGLYDNEYIQEHAVFLASQKVSSEAAGELAKHIAYMEAIDFTNIVANNTMIDIEDLKIQEQLVWPYIVNYIHTPKDAAYLIKLINHNAKANTFLGFISSELFTKSQFRDKGNPITPAQGIAIDKLMGMYADDNYKMSQADKDLLAKTDFKDLATLQQLVADYLR